MQGKILFRLEPKQGFIGPLITRSVIQAVGDDMTRQSFALYGVFDGKKSALSIAVRGRSSNGTR